MDVSVITGIGQLSLADVVCLFDYNTAHAFVAVDKDRV